MSFSTIIGHEQAIMVLRRSVFSGRVSHGYLFAGPANVGKTLLAMEFAKAVNCERGPGFGSPQEVDACDACPSCVRVMRDAHADVHVFRPVARMQTETEEGGIEPTVIEGSMITTDQIGDLVEAAHLKASQGRRKVFIVCSAETMNPIAANRLLKTLEEPPGETTLILTTENLSGLLPTIISRCQLLTLRPVPLAQAQTALQARYPDVEAGVLRSVVTLSGGRIGRALRLLERQQVLELRAGLLDLAASLPKRAWFEGMVLGERLMEAAEAWWLATEEREMAEKALKASRDRVLRTRMNDVLDVLLTWFRDLAVLAAGGEMGLVINADRAQELAALATGRSPAKYRKACEDIEQTRKQLRGNANLRLACEVLALRLINACR